MALDEVTGATWTRKHDDIAVAVVPSTPRTVFVHSLEDCIEVCKTRQRHQRIRAAGSHWALSEAWEHNPCLACVLAYSLGFKSATVRYPRDCPYAFLI
jgi:hypothetical protein